MSPSFSACICRMTAARFVRWISGSVNSGRARKSSSEYRRIAMPGPDAAAAAGALVRRGLRDLLDGQSLQPAAMAVAADARDAGVDHRADAGHGQRGLGDVGRQHDAPAARRPEHALLLFLREPRVQRQHLATLRMVLAQRFGGLADLALAAQEHEDVAGLLAPQLIDGREDRGLLVDAVSSSSSSSSTGR